MRADAVSTPAVSVVPVPRMRTTSKHPRPRPTRPLTAFSTTIPTPKPAISGGGSVNWPQTWYVELRAGDSTERRATDSETAARFAAADSGIEEDSLLGALGRGAGDAPGPIPGLRITAPEDELGAEVARLISIVDESVLGPSGARRNLTARRSRSPADVVRTLIGAYGYTLDPVVYTQGVSIGGRLTAWEMGITQDDPTGNIRQIAGPLLADPGPFFESGPDGAALAGLTWACDLARITGDQQAKSRCSWPRLTSSKTQAIPCRRPPPMTISVSKTCSSSLPSSDRRTS